MIDHYQILRQIKTQTKSSMIKFASLRTVKKVNREEREIYVVITIDTEQDVNEKYVNTGTYHNIDVGLPNLLDIFDKYNCKASWMVTPDVATKFSDLFNKLYNEKHEIGCHVHPEYFLDHSISHIQHKIYLCNLSMNLQKEMICKATNIIEQSIGKRPVSFRAGKYGIDNTTMNLLASEGYLVDTSVCPNVSWGRNDAPDWSEFHNTQPYFHNSLLEVPVTIIRVMGFNYWARPSISTPSTMKAIVENILSKNQGSIVVNIMFHSMECIDPNPYLNSNLFLKRLDILLKYLRLKNVNFVTLEQLHNIWILNNKDNNV